MAPPLAESEVLDPSCMAPGPFCTLLLSEPIASVTSAERPSFGVLSFLVDGSSLLIGCTGGAAVVARCGCQQLSNRGWVP